MSYPGGPYRSSADEASRFGEDEDEASSSPDQHSEPSGEGNPPGVSSEHPSRTLFVVAASIVVFCLFVFGLYELGKIPRTFKVEVDFNKTYSQMIAAGNYKEVDEELQKFDVMWRGEDLKNIGYGDTTLPPNGKVEVKMELVHLKGNEKFDDVLKELDRRGLRPANIPELLAFGAKYPEEQVKYPIIALGPFWTNNKQIYNYQYLVYIWSHGRDEWTRREFKHKDTYGGRFYIWSDAVVAGVRK